MVWAYSGIANDDATTGDSKNCHAVCGVSQRKPLKPSERWGANLKVEERSTEASQKRWSPRRGHSSSQTTKPAEL